MYSFAISVKVHDKDSMVSRDSEGKQSKCYKSEDGWFEYECVCAAETKKKDEESSNGS